MSEDYRKLGEKANVWKKAPHLNERQEELLQELDSVYSHYYFLDRDHFSKKQLELSESEPVETSKEFFKWYTSLEKGLEDEENNYYNSEREDLLIKQNQCEEVLINVDSMISSLDKLKLQYDKIANKTNGLHNVSEHLIKEQNRLDTIYNEINEKLEYFNEAEKVVNVLSSTISVSSEKFVEVLDKIDKCLIYVSEHGKYRESYAYQLKYRQCLSKAISLINEYVTGVFNTACESVTSPKNQSEKLWVINRSENSNIMPVVSVDAAFTLYYGKFQSLALKVKPVIDQVEKRAANSSDYDNLLTECLNNYLSKRLVIMNDAVADAVSQLTENYKGDHSTLFRSGFLFLYQVCQDEVQLFHSFFSKSTPTLMKYLESLCSYLYDALRPFVIHINHLETLAELCGILRIEILEEHENINEEPMEAFGRTVWHLLQDVQERLVYRTHVYFQTDLLQYKPSPGDLAYPEKLEMMESIASSLRSDSVSDVEEKHRSRTGNSPADLHGMWYPTVKRTLVCLSRLYRCVDRPIFQGLSQEAIVTCIQTISSAAATISANKTVVDGELFQIKHLLILREQIAPFQVDFTVKEMSLDFSKFKTAAFGLLQKRSRLFSLSSNNALLEFLLEGTPQVKEQLVDSRKEVDKQLKHSCEEFITHVTGLLLQPLLSFIEQVNEFHNNPQTQSSSKLLKDQSFAKREVLSAIVKDVQKRIKTQVSGIQYSMQLYLANRETEFILFRPIKNNIGSSFVHLEQVLSTGGYTAEDLLIIACPSSEQVSVLLSSSSLLGAREDKESGSDC